MDMREVSEELKLRPFVSWNAGMQRRTPTGLMLEGTYDIGYWCSEAYTVNEEQINNVLYTLLAELEKHRLFLARLNESGGASELMIAIFMGEMSDGPELEWELLKGMADLRLYVGFNILC